MRRKIIIKPLIHRWLCHHTHCRMCGLRCSQYCKKLKERLIYTILCVCVCVFSWGEKALRNDSCASATAVHTPRSRRKTLHNHWWDEGKCIVSPCLLVAYHYFSSAIYVCATRYCCTYGTVSRISGFFFYNYNHTPQANTHTILAFVNADIEHFALFKKWIQIKEFSCHHKGFFHDDYSLINKAWLLRGLTIEVTPTMMMRRQGGKSRPNIVGICARKRLLTLS